VRPGRHLQPDSARRLRTQRTTVPRLRAVRPARSGAAGAAVPHSAGAISDDLPYSLVTRVVDELMRRGVRALEAFGRTEATVELAERQTIDEDLRPVLDSLGDCSIDRCVIAADFLQNVGFAVVAPHRFFPRLRLELDKGLGWKAEVEAALERLLESARLQTAGLQEVSVGSLVTNR
jgi:hypothetical protein